MARAESVIRVLKTPPLSRYRLPRRPTTSATIKPPPGLFPPIERPSHSPLRAVISFLCRQVTFSTTPTKWDPISCNFWLGVATAGKKRTGKKKGHLVGKATSTPSRGVCTSSSGQHSGSLWRGWHSPRKLSWGRSSTPRILHRLILAVTLNSISRVTDTR